MGWIHTLGATKNEVVRELTMPWSNSDKRVETIAAKTVGNVLYGIVEVTYNADASVQRIAVVYLLSNPRRDGWGYKAMDETVGPCEVGFPVEWLDRLTAPLNEWAAKWREEVRSHKANKAALASLLKGLKVGDQIHTPHYGTGTYEIAKEMAGNTLPLVRRIEEDGTVPPYVYRLGRSHALSIITVETMDGGAYAVRQGKAVDSLGKPLVSA